MAGFANDTVYGNNADFSVAASKKGSINNGLLTNGQMWIGTTATNVGGTHINVGTLISPLGTVTIGYSSPNITLEVAGGAAAIEKINLQAGTSPIVPSGGIITFNGATVAAGTNPVRTDGTGANTMALQVQISQAIASTDATKIGLAAFDSADFTVDANGFVSASTTGFLKTLTGNSGGAIAPVANNINTVGTGSITIAGAGSTLTTQLTGLTNHNVLVGAGTATITNVAPSATSGVPLISQGAAADPVFGTAVVAGGGTGATSFNINGVVISNTTTTTPLAALTLTNGQVVIGSTGNPPAAATLTAGTGISITNGANSITIASTGSSMAWTDESTSFSAAAGNGYFVTGTATATLPASPSQGNVISFIVDTANVLTIQANTGQVIRIGAAASASAGTAASTAIGSSVTLIYRASDTTWLAREVIGTWTVT